MSTALPFWHDMPELQGEVPPLTADDLFHIALRQTYSLRQWLDRDDEARTQRLLDEDVAAMLDDLQDAIVGPVRIEPMATPQQLIRESRQLLHTLEHLYNRKGCRYAKALGMAERRHERRRDAEFSINHANLDAWCESRARDFDVTDEIPF